MLTEGIMKACSAWSRKSIAHVKLCIFVARFFTVYINKSLHICFAIIIGKKLSYPDHP